MQITNNFDLPDAIVRAVSKSIRPYQENVFSMTELERPPLMAYLSRQYDGEITEDASDRLWTLLGTCMHYVLENHAGAGDLSEHYMTHDLVLPSGRIVTLRGTADLISGLEISDYKVTSVYSFLLGDKPEWERQLNKYRLLYYLTTKEKGNPILIEKLQIHAILRDWTISKVGQHNYPPIGFYTVDIPVWDIDDAMSLLISNIYDHISPNPRNCTDEERWYRGDSFAIIKGDNKRAHRVFDTEAEAYHEMENLKGKKDYTQYKIVKRKGSYNRCEKYCSVARFCPQFAIDKKTSEE